MSERLEALLFQAGRSIEYPTTPTFDLSAPARSRSRVRPFLVGVAVAASLLMVLAFPGPRAAIADLFGIGAVEFQVVDGVEPSALSGSFTGEEVTLEAAIAGVDFELLTLDQDADVVFLGDSITGGLVTLAYGQGESGFSVLITQLHARSDEPSLQKLLSGVTAVVPVDVDGNRGFWIEDEHTIALLDQEDNPIVDTARLAASTLLVVADQVTIRIEGDLTLDEAVGIARALD